MANIGATRIQDFTRMNPSLILGSKSEEDPQEFFYIVHKVTDIMSVTLSEIVDFSTYQLQDIAHRWYKQWKKNKGVDKRTIE